MQSRRINYLLSHFVTARLFAWVRAVFVKPTQKVMLFACLLTAASSVAAQQSALITSTDHLVMPILQADPNANFNRVLPPNTIRRRGPTATFDVTFNPPSCEATEAWPADAKMALKYAARLWGNIIVSPIVIDIHACWIESTRPGNLASAYFSLVRDAENLPLAGTWYPDALGDAYAGMDIFPDHPEITVRFNSVRSDWYFGTEGNPTADQYDFVTVAMHEIGHGLGVHGSFRTESSVGDWGFYVDQLPVVYDNAIVNGHGQALTDTSLYPRPSLDLGLELVSNNIYFDGPRVRAANGGSSAPVFAPYLYIPGSSVSHLDESTFNNTANAMMTPYLGRSEVAHDPGPVGLAMLRDIGWKLAATDADNDGKEDFEDNCPSRSNPDQRDTDEDGRGDVCDTDMDNDGIVNRIDNCRRIANADQRDIDSDEIGDACDLDKDGDGVDNTVDNCPVRPNPDQQNIDGDHLGDACDADRDGDGHRNSADNCPIDANPDQADSDFDGIGNACEAVIIGDLDGDGVKDELDNCPAVVNPGQRDSDADGAGDACEDADGDGVVDGLDNCPTVANADQVDADVDQIGDACEPGVRATARQRATVTQSATVTVRTPAVATATAQATQTKVVEVTAWGSTQSRARQTAKLQALRDATLMATKAARTTARMKARQAALAEARRIARRR